MSPAPTARARRSPSCARCWRPPARSVHVYTSPHLVRFNERFRLGAPGGGRLVGDEALAAVLEECERANGARADHGVRDRDRRGVPAVLAPSRRRDAARSRPRRPARRHQRDREAARLRDHAGVDGSPGVSRRHDREDRRREGRDPQARRAGGDRAADRRRARASSSRRPSACARRCASRASTGACMASTAAWSIRTTTGCSICRCRSSPAAIRSKTPAPPSPRLRAAGLALPIVGLRGGHRQGGMAGADAAPHARQAQGADAAGERAVARRRPQRRWRRAVAAAIGDLEERVPRPLVLIVGMLSTKDNVGFLRNFPGIARRVIAVPVPRQDKSVAGRDAGGHGARRRHSGGEPRHARSGARRGRRGWSFCPRRAS